MNPEDPATETAEQRRAPRRPIEAPIRMRIENEILEGVSDNISGVGLMFFAEEPVRVVIEVEENGALRRYKGRLVRAQRMTEDTTGYAIEFDPE